MKKEYDFSKGVRGPAIPTPGKTRITIRIDDDVLAWFRLQIEKACRGSYQTMMNKALRDYMDSREGHNVDMVRRVIREELAGYSVKRAGKSLGGRKKAGASARSTKKKSPK